MTLRAVPQFDTTVYDRLAGRLENAEKVLEDGAKGLKEGVKGLGEKVAGHLKDVDAHGTEVAENASLAMWAGVTAAVDGGQGLADTGRAGKAWMKGAAKTGAAYATEAFEDIAGFAKEVVNHIRVALSDGFYKMSEVFLHRASNVLKEQLLKPNASREEIRSAIMKALNEGLATHDISRELIFSAGKDFKVAGEKGQEALKHFTDAYGDALAGGAAAYLVLDQSARLIADLARAAKDEGKALAYEAAILANRGLLATVKLAEKGTENVRQFEGGVDKRLGEAFRHVSDAMLLAAERGSLDQNKLGSLRTKIEALERAAA